MHSTTSILFIKNKQHSRIDLLFCAEIFLNSLCFANVAPPFSVPRVSSHVKYMHRFSLLFHIKISVYLESSVYRSTQSPVAGVVLSLKSHCPRLHVFIGPKTKVQRVYHNNPVHSFSGHVVRMQFMLFPYLETISL